MSVFVRSTYVARFPTIFPQEAPAKSPTFLIGFIWWQANCLSLWQAWYCVCWEHLHCKIPLGGRCREHTHRDTHPVESIASSIISLVSSYPSLHLMTNTHIPTTVSGHAVWHCCSPLLILWVWLAWLLWTTTGPQTVSFCSSPTQVQLTNDNKITWLVKCHVSQSDQSVLECCFQPVRFLTVTAPTWGQSLILLSLSWKFKRKQQWSPHMGFSLCFQFIPTPHHQWAFCPFFVFNWEYVSGNDTDLSGEVQKSASSCLLSPLWVPSSRKVWETVEQRQGGKSRRWVSAWWCHAEAAFPSDCSWGMQSKSSMWKEPIHEWAGKWQKNSNVSQLLWMVPWMGSSPAGNWFVQRGWQRCMWKTTLC